MRRGLPAVIVCVLAGAGCASEEGLLVDIDVDYETVFPDDVDEIDVWVGVPAAGGSTTEFVRSEELGDRVAVGGLPFRLLVYADADPRPVWVGAFAYDGERTGPVAEGTLAAPVMVMPGELAYRTITLEATDRAIGNCVFQPGDAAAGTEPLVIRPPASDATALDCDNDGQAAGLDCNDLDANVSTGAPERCDGIDNNCDGVCDDVDLDGDYYSPCSYPAGCTIECTDGSSPPANLLGGCDCDETDATANPAGSEAQACDAVDSNCDGADGGTPMGGEVPGNQIDDDCDGSCDVDGDGDLITGPPTLPGTWVMACDPARADCDDGAPETYPNALEGCDGIDTNCSGEAELIERRPCFVDGGGVGCQLGERTCADALGVPGVWGPCGPLSGRQVASELCSVWSSVESAAWPERALFEARPAEERTACVLDAWRPFDRNEVCPGAVAPLEGRLGDADPCETFIVDGGAFADWTLKLSTRDANPVTGPVVPSCNVALLVESVRGEGLSDVRLPSLWTIIVQQRLDPVTMVPTEAVATPLEIRVHYANATTSFACPPARSLTCDEP